MFLPEAEFLFDKLSANDEIDYSPVVLEMCKSFENEIKEKFFNKFILEYSQVHLSDFEEHIVNDNNAFYYNVYKHERVKICKEIEDFIDAIISCVECKRRGTESDPVILTLGAMHRYLSDVSNKSIRENSVLLSDFYDFLCKHFEFNQLINEGFLNSVKYVKDTLRNPSAHTNIVTLRDVERCNSNLPEKFDEFINKMK